MSMEKENIIEQPGSDPQPDVYDISSWDELDIDANILRGIYAYGFEKPSPIQQKAIKPVIMGKDIIAQAQSGTGKTATFTIGALSKVDLGDDSTQVMILRESCVFRRQMLSRVLVV